MFLFACVVANDRDNGGNENGSVTLATKFTHRHPRVLAHQVSRGAGLQCHRTQFGYHKIRRKSS
jgi:hypothetical protein